MKNNRNKIILVIILISIIILFGIGTYAFFSASLSGNSNDDNLVLETRTLKIEYVEGQNIDAPKIEPGWSGKKHLVSKIPEVSQ